MVCLRTATRTTSTWSTWKQPSPSWLEGVTFEQLFARMAGRFRQGVGGAMVAEYVATEARPGNGFPEFRREQGSALDHDHPAPVAEDRELEEEAVEPLQDAS